MQSKSESKPFLRWAGGKRWFTKHLKDILGELEFNSYHEPFLGGGSVFFKLNNSKKAYLSDLNEDLISTYIEVRDNVTGVIQYLQSFNNTEEFYYQLRSAEPKSDKSWRAARFIYLNQTSFNGIYRVNLKGVYNVPYGHRTKDFIQKDLLEQASKKLKGVYLFAGQFEKALSNIKKNDLVFLDPPYTITHNDNGFLKYNQKLFSESDQIRLSTFIDQVKSKGAYYILTNAAHKRVKEIFDKGDRSIELSRASLIGGKEANRGKYAELIVTNV